MRNDTIKAIKEFRVKTFGNKNSIERTEKLLDTGEEVLFLSPTNCTITSINTGKKETLPGVAVLTNNRFIFNYKAALDTLTETVPIDEIRAVNCRGNSINGGHVEIHTITKTYDILVSYKREIIQKIQRIFNQVSRANDVSSQQVVNSDVGDLLKYKELLDAGIITQDEFEQKKKQLLGL